MIQCNVVFETKGEMSSSAGKQNEGKEADANRMFEMLRCGVQAEGVGGCCARVGEEKDCWRRVGVLAEETCT